MTVSVVEPIGAALNRTGQVLFRPFDVKKWLILGFCAFLAYLGEGGGPWYNQSSYHQSARRRAGDFGPDDVQRIVGWIQAHLVWIIAIAVALYFLVLVLTAVFLWLRCRGQFMFIDGIALNRPAVVEPWKSFRRLGNSLFAFRMILSVLSFFIPIATIAAGLAIAWPDIEAWRFGDSALLGIVVCGAVLIVTGFVFLIINLLLEDFVVPAMYLRDEGVINAWGIVREEVLAGHVGSVVLFYVMRLILTIGITFMAMVATCATLCIAALPYIGTVILLPLFVFKRCYSLCFLEQFGEAWRVFFDEMYPASCHHCGCDFKGRTGLEACPECGVPIELIVPGSPPSRPAPPPRPYLS
ncbi:MAG: hypothetical protein JSV91_03820 [Phycisphaerales bacterium]|nr:MAG: hypothetical protein JSV91_03820 [Phycisphaerales bacterium]